MPSRDPSQPGVRRVRKRLADGTVKVYEYHHPPRPRGATLPADSLRALLDAYERSREWRDLAPRTQKNRLIALRHLHPIQHLSVTGLRRREILTMRDAIAEGIGSGAANGFISHLAALLRWAVDREWIEHSPAERIRSLPGGHFPTWSEDDLARALDKVPEPIRRALVLAVHTGQRRGDLVALTWAAYDEAAGRLTIMPEKTRRARERKGMPALRLPVHPDLAAELARWREKRQAVTILEDGAGRPWDRDGLTMAVMRALEPLGMKGLNVHGLRKLAAVRLAEAGATPHEIAAVTGHASLVQVALYTAGADQERLARAAVARLETAPRKPSKPG